MRELGRWGGTALATVVSTYALDAVASAVGLLLVATGVLSQLDRTALLVLIAVTYLVWGLGLRAGVGANRELLVSTGTSTNLVSKALHDLAAARSWSPRSRRLVAAGGYVGTEAVKEIPYYAAAFGASALSESVTADEALIFLAGTNLGAAGYEYVLARVTRGFLRRRGARPARVRIPVRPPGLDGSSLVGDRVLTLPGETHAEADAGRERT